MTWKQFVEGTLSAVYICAFMGLLYKRVNAGIGNEAENELVKNLQTVMAQYEQKALLDAKTAEQAEITEMQRKFNQKYGLLESGHVQTHIDKQ